VFWNSTDTIKRARIAGLIGFGSVIFYFTTNMVSLSVLNFSENIALCLLLVLGSLIGSIVFREEKNNDLIIKKIVYYPEKRTIIFYAGPWILFSFLNVTLTNNITAITSVLSSSTMYLLLYGSQVIGGVFGALIGGYFADKVGRRSTLAFSVALYGVSMAFRGFIDNGAAFVFSFIGEGLTWGVFLTLYCFVIWGDLSNTKNTEKIYGLGLLIFYLTAGLGVFNLFAGIPVVESTLISCIMIFLAIVPIVLAPELLTSDAQEKNRLRKYMETVRKVADDLD
jgi:magnesium-transporting ATPase (P-type)